MRLTVAALALLISSLLSCSSPAECPQGTEKTGGYCHMTDPASTTDYQRPEPLDVVAPEDHHEDGTTGPDLLSDTPPPPDLAAELTDSLPDDAKLQDTFEDQLHEEIHPDQS